MVAMLQQMDLSGYPARCVDFEEDALTADPALAPAQASLDGDLDGELFMDFPSQGAAWILLRLHLAAGEFPFERRRHFRASLRRQTSVMAQNGGADDVQERHGFRCRARANRVAHMVGERIIVGPFGSQFWVSLK